MAQQVKIPQGNSFVLELICMKQINDTGDKIAFDMAASENIAISFFDETHENNIELTDWSFAPGTNNVIRVNVDGTNLPVQSKLGLIISGIDPQGEKFKTKIRGRNFIYVVGSISDVSANDFITNPLTIQVTMNIMGDLNPVNFDDFVTVEVLEEKEAETLAAAKQYTDEAIAAITGPDLSNYATKEYADNAATGAVNSANAYTNSTALSLRSEYVAGINHEKDERVAAVNNAISTANAYTDAAIAAITGTGGGVTQEYVDNAVSGCLNDANSYTDDAIDAIIPVPYEEQYLTFEITAGGTITVLATNASASKTISYSTDNGSTWTDLTTSTDEQSLGAFAIGDKVLIKGTNDSYVTNFEYNRFSGTAQTKVYGNIMSLIYGDNFIGQTSFPSNSSYNFGNLFYNYTNLIDASNLILPPTTLTNWCYQYMFAGCTNLVHAPELPATTLATNCYQNMFQNCTSLTQVPRILPATRLASCCYQNMFQNCTSLTQTPELPATTIAQYCYQSMFSGCTSLTQAPELPATTLENNCYSYMFDGCTNLEYVKALFITASSTHLKRWLKNVSLVGTFIKSDSAEWGDPQTIGIPGGWGVYTDSEYNYVRMYEVAPLSDDITKITTRTTPYTEPVVLENAATEWYLSVGEELYRYFYFETEGFEPYFIGGINLIIGDPGYLEVPNRIFILRFNTGSSFSPITISSEDANIPVKFIGKDISELEADKEYEVMIEYAFDELIYSWAEITTPTVNP